MAGAKETSRQKMIGMMYLVLTALLAMNVSKEVLNAFVVINESLYKSNKVFKNNNEQMLAEFELAKAKDSEKFTVYYDKAMMVNKMAGDLYDHIEDLKKHLIMATDDKTPAAADTLVEKMMGVDAKDNYDIPTEIMIGSESQSPKTADVKWSALELKKKIENYRDELLKLLESKTPSGRNIFLDYSLKTLSEKIVKSLELRDGVENGVFAKWEIINFYHLPLAAVITNLSKIQTDINNVQGDMIAGLYAEVKRAESSFDRLSARVMAESNYILQGDEYEADVLLIAGNSTIKPKIMLGEIDTTIKDEFKNPLKGGGTELSEITSGGAKYRVKTNNEGLQTWAGVIEVESAEGKKYYPFESKYMVAKPAASISPDKLNVFYAGIDNPITITAAGVPAENISASIRGNGAVISGEKGKYTVKVKGGVEAFVTVNAKINGETRNMGEFKFRVKRVPKPQTQFNGKTGNFSMARNLIKSGQGIRPHLENFDFQVPYTIKSFRLTLISNNIPVTEDVTGNKFNDAQKRLLNSIQTNNIIIIENVVCEFPDGTREVIDGVTIRVQ